MSTALVPAFIACSIKNKRLLESDMPSGKSIRQEIWVCALK
jgi:hypothetical protein